MKSAINAPVSARLSQSQPRCRLPAPGGIGFVRYIAVIPNRYWTRIRGGA
jgi:hypothetical protein